VGVGERLDNQISEDFVTTRNLQCESDDRQFFMQGSDSTYHPDERKISLRYGDRHRIPEMTKRRGGTGLTLYPFGPTFANLCRGGNIERDLNAYRGDHL